MDQIVEIEEMYLLELVRKVIREELERVYLESNQLKPPGGMIRKPLYKIKEVCTLFSISKPTVYEWIRKGKLHPVKVQSRVFFKGSDIDGLIMVDKPQ
jgi:excisionase family DNA binding protein